MKIRFKPTAAISGKILTFKVSRSVGKKLFLIFFVSILACVLIMGLISYQISKSIIEEKVSDSSQSTMKQLAGKMDLIFDNFEDMSMQFVTDTTLQNMMNSVLFAGDDRSRGIAERELNNKLNSMVLGMSGVKNLNLIPVNELNHVLGTGNLSIDEVKETAWYKEGFELSTGDIWIPTQPQGFQNQGEPTIGLAKGLREPGGIEPAYILLIEIKDRLFQSHLQEAGLGNGGQISFIDNQDRILMDSVGRENMGKTSALGFSGRIVGDQDSGMFKDEANGTEVLALYHKLSSNPWTLTGTIPISELVKDATKIYKLTVYVSIGAALLAALIGFVIIRMVGTPLLQLRNLMNEGRQGNLAVRASVRGKDEISQLSVSFNEMMEQISELVRQTHGSAELVLATAGELGEASRRTAGAAREIAVATEEIAGGATSLAMESEKGSDLTSEIDVSMKRVKLSNAGMRTAAGQVEAASQQGTGYMAALIDKTGDTERMVRGMKEKVDRLKDSTRSIVKIMDVLSGVAQQTNILSLNASIEAARAGTAGKGFMVVADEIRQLAEQSRQSINVVEGITDTIQREIEETVAALAEAQPIFQEQIGSVKEANGIFLEVQMKMTNLTESLESVTESIAVLDGAQLQLSEAMSSVSAVAEQSSATSEEVASLSSEQLGVSEGLVELSAKLEGVSLTLQQSLEKFKID